ncbi:TerD family protein [Streptomyces sp. NBC_01236]|uniref:TerD family protein n=1 Tax=Streptomyces sp. NBC_01236 TaxID=2903789 RepID=UPI002E0F1589|nr:TerD family protein [Streptomyces sp. NBC_01236]
MTIITKGANTPVPAGMLRVAVCRRNVPGTPAVDASALLLDAAGKVRGDADLVFYNQPAHPSGAVRHVGTAEGGGQLAEWLELDLPRVEPDVQRVVIAGSCDGGTFGAVPGLAVQALNGDGTVVAHYEVTDASSETAFVLGEFYRRNGEWKFRAVGQGYASGLAGLATDFGIAVEGAEATAPVPTPAPAPAPTPTLVTAPAPAPARPPQDTAPHAFGPDFQPYVQQGQGNGVVSVDMPIPPGPVIVEVWHEGEGYFGMHTLNRRNKDDDLVYNTTLEDFRGRALVRPPEGRALRLRVEADNDWTVRVQPLSVVRELGSAALRGYGPEVVAYRGPAADIDVVFEGDEDGGGYFGLSCLEADKLHNLNSADLLINDTDRLRQTVPVPDGPLLLLLEADGPWRLTARPVPSFDEPPDPAPATIQAPTPAPATVKAPTPAPTVVKAPAPASVQDSPRGVRHLLGLGGEKGTVKGKGDRTAELTNPDPGRPAILEYEIANESEHRTYDVTYIDQDGKEKSFLNHGINGAHGRAVVFGGGQDRVRLRFEKAGRWKLRLLPIEDAPPLTGPTQGTGSVVLRYDGPPTVLRARTLEQSWMYVHTIQAHRMIALCTMIIGLRTPATGPLWVSEAGYCYVQIGLRPELGWHIEPLPLETVRAFGGPAKLTKLEKLDKSEHHRTLDTRISGSGCEVVRHTGPETEIKVDGKVKIWSIFELDEYLQPVRQIGNGRGVHRLPPGLFHIRGVDDWTIEPQR